MTNDALYSHLLFNTREFAIITDMALQATIGTSTFHVGDTVGVKYRLIEKEKVAGKAKREVKEETRERIQEFEGIVLGIRGEGENKSFIVRRIASDAIGVERVFPLMSPWIKDVVVKKEAVIRRAKLYYLRDMVGRAAVKLKEKHKAVPKKAKPAVAKEATAKVEATVEKPAKKTAKKKEASPANASA